MATVEELLRLREELAAKVAQVKELEETAAQLQEELARLKGEEPPPVAAKVPWWKSWKTWLGVGGITVIITGIGIAIKRRKK